MTSADPVVAFDSVRIDRGTRTVFSQGTFHIHPGAITAIIGPNGAGKTTLVEMVLGLLQPTQGEVTVFGQRPARGDARIGYVPQHYTDTLGDAVRCRDLVALGLTGSRWGISRLGTDERERVDGALESVGALDVADRRLAELSGGQRQRVAIAHALVHRPELLLLDEPLASLDLRSQTEIVDLLRTLHLTYPMSIFVVVHDLNPVLSILTGAVYLLDGHPHYGAIGDVVDSHLLSHLYGADVQVIRTPQGDLFTRTV